MPTTWGQSHLTAAAEAVQALLQDLVVSCAGTDAAIIAVHVDNNKANVQLPAITVGTEDGTVQTRSASTAITGLRVTIRGQVAFGNNRTDQAKAVAIAAAIINKLRSNVILSADWRLLGDIEFQTDAYFQKTDTWGCQVIATIKNEATYTQET